MFVLDTNTLIYFFKGMGGIAANLLASSPREIGIPAIVLFELETGIAKSETPQKRTDQLKDFMEAVKLLPFDRREARTAARIRADLEKEGQKIGPYDLLIAATALAGNHTLVTHNVKEFRRVKGLGVVDWF